MRIYTLKPKSKPKKIKHWTTKPDLDNLIKSILDPLNGVFWRDDSIIIKLEATKSYGDTARIEVEIYEIEMEVSNGRPQMLVL